MVECPHCNQKTISSFKVHTSDPGKALICSECKKSSTVPSAPKVIGLICIIMFFLTKSLMEDDTAITILITFLVLYIPYAYFASQKLLPIKDDENSPSTSI